MTEINPDPSIPPDDQAEIYKVCYEAPYWTIVAVKAHSPTEALRIAARRMLPVKAQATSIFVARSDGLHKLEGVLDSDSATRTTLR